VFSSVVIIGTADAQNEKILTIPLATEIAFHARPTLKKFDWEIDAAENVIHAALAGYLPHVFVDTKTGTSAESFFSPQHSVNISMQQLLYSLAGPIQERQIARRDLCALCWRKELEYDRIRHETELSIFDLWNINKKEGFAHWLNIAAYSYINQQAHSHDLGLINLDTWLASVAEFRNAEAIVKEYADQETIARTNVARSLGIDTANNLILTNATDNYIQHIISIKNCYTPEEYYAMALINRKELSANDAEIQREYYKEQLFKRSYFPVIGLFMDMIRYRYKNESTTVADTSILRTGWRLGFQMTWEFDGLANVFNATIAEDTAFALTMQRLELTEQIKQDVNNSESALQISLKDLAAQEAQYRQAKNAFILRQEEYAIGLISAVELKEAVARWESAQYDLVDKQTTVAKRHSDLLFACGYPKKLINITETV